MEINPELNVRLANYTTFQIGGDADLLFKTKNKEELIEVLNWVKKKGINYKVIGGGSNLLISDRGFRGLVILNRQGSYKIKDERVVADSGVNLSKIARETITKGYKSLDFATGIPGTIGGAVAGNAGAYGKEMSDSILVAEIWEEGEIKTYYKDDFEFDYRHSKLKNDGNRVILSVTLKLKRGDVSEMNELTSFDVAKRSTDYSGRNAGSYFINIPVEDLTDEQTEKFINFIYQGKLNVGKMIQDLGLKGLKVGGAMISENHANVIQNIGGATSADVVELEKTVIDRVLAAYGIILRSEVIKLGDY